MSIAVAGMGWWLVFGLSWILFFGGVLFFVFSAPVRRRSEGRYRETAIEIARQRYVAGEITRQEFERTEEELPK